MYLSWEANGSGVIGTYTSTARSGRLIYRHLHRRSLLSRSWARTRKEDGWWEFGVAWIGFWFVHILWTDGGGK